MRALVLSGGGARGQYHLGALRYLYQQRKLQHQIISGVSVGALIGSFLAQFPYGIEATAIDRLTEIFSKLQTKDIHKPWRPFGLLEGFFYKSSFRDSSPMRKLVQEYIRADEIAATGRKLRVGVTLLHPLGGESNYHVYTEDSLNLQQAITASAALSPILEPVELDGQLAIDGCVQAVTPIKAAILAGATVIDMVVCYPPYLVFPRTARQNAIDLGLHALDLMIHKLTWIDVEHTQYVNQMVLKNNESNKRYVTLNVIHPSDDFGIDSLKFVPSEARLLQEQGFADAQKTQFHA